MKIIFLGVFKCLHFNAFVEVTNSAEFRTGRYYGDLSDSYRHGDKVYWLESFLKLVYMQ